MEKSSPPVRRLRIQRGITQAELADAAGISRTAMNNLEKGRSKGSPATLGKIARVLGVHIEDLIEQDPSPKAQAPSLDDELAALTVSKFRTLLTGLRESWTLDENDNLAAMREAELKARELGVSTDDLRRALEARAPLAVKQLDEAERQLRAAIAQLERELKQEGA